jgi:hypothetical protein
MENRGSIPSRDKGFSLLHNVQTGSGTHPAYYTMNNMSLSLRVNRHGREADDSLPTYAEVKNGGALPSPPICLHGIVLNYIIKYRENFITSL